MEAKARHTFTPTQDDDLGFQKNEIVNILDMDQDKNWYKAEKDGREGWIPNTYIEMEAHDWFQGKITRKQAEDVLMETRNDGAFLVRESESSPGEFSLSVRFHDQVQHFKVFRDADRRYFLWNKKFPSLNKLLDHHRQNSVSRSQHIVLKDLSEVVQATFDFEAQEEGEISFKRGDCITVLDNSDVNWWKGKVINGSGEEGMFPSNYVKPR